jgi:[NiFe] hydrogenase diaphorase moiety large subunit
VGASIGGRAGFDFDIEIHVGAGSYVCGEASALVESLEGKRGIPRIIAPPRLAEKVTWACRRSSTTSRPTARPR